MTLSIMTAMVVFALALSASPGPVNIMTLSAAATNGIPRTMPFVVGASLGFTGLLFAIGLGIGVILNDFPMVLPVIRYSGLLFLLYLAYRIYNADVSLSTSATKPPSFLVGAMMQWLNPKAWAACLSGVTLFDLQANQSALIIFCSLYFLSCLVGVGAWSVVGAFVAKILDEDHKIRRFNQLMGTLLALVALAMVIS